MNLEERLAAKEKDNFLRWWWRPIYSNREKRALNHNNVRLNMGSPKKVHTFFFLV